MENLQNTYETSEKVNTFIDYCKAEIIEVLKDNLELIHSDFIFLHINKSGLENEGIKILGENKPELIFRSIDFAIMELRKSNLVQ